MKYFYPTPAFYTKLAEEVINAIDGRTYASIDIDLPDYNGFSVYFKATLLVYYDKEERFMTDLVPIWWEFEVYNFDGNRIGEVDITFADIKKHVLHLAK